MHASRQASHYRSFPNCISNLLCSPVWGGFLYADLTGKINALFRRLYLATYVTVSDLLGKADTVS